MPSSSDKEEAVDYEAEQDLAAVSKQDPLSAYDVDVGEEGCIIQRYLAMLH